jgi:hypothetical protein
MICLLDAHSQLKSNLDGNDVAEPPCPSGESYLSSAKLPYLKTGEPDQLKSNQWIEGLAFNAYGVRVGVRSNAPGTLKTIESHLPMTWKRSASPVVDRLFSVVISPTHGRGSRRPHSIYEDDKEIAWNKNLSMLFDNLESSLRLHVAEMTRRRVFVHAGVVAWKGQAIIIPARSLGGKSTLTAEFVRAGATYYSDEYAVLDSRGRVHPYAKPISIRNSKDYSQTDHPVEYFGGVAGTRPLPVGLVLLTKYKRGAKWRPLPVSPGKGVLAILNQTVSARRHPDKAFEALRAVVAHAKIVKSLRGEAKEVVQAVLKSLRQQ